MTQFLSKNIRDYDKPGDFLPKLAEAWSFRGWLPNLTLDPGRIYNFALEIYDDEISAGKKLACTTDQLVSIYETLIQDWEIFKKTHRGGGFDLSVPALDACLEEFKRTYGEDLESNTNKKTENIFITYCVFEILHTMITDSELIGILGGGSDVN